MASLSLKRLLGEDADAKSFAWFAIGLSMLTVFLRRSFYGVALASLPDTQFGYVVFWVVAVATAFAALVFRVRLTAELSSNPRPFVAACALASLFLLALHGFGLVVGGIMWGWLSAMLLGFAFVTLTITWGQAALALAVKNCNLALCSTVMAFALGYILSTLAVPLGSFAPGLFLAFPLLSALCWTQCPRRQVTPSTKFEKLKQLPLTRIMVPGAFLLLISLLRGLYYAGSIDYRPGLDAIAPNVLSIIMALVIIGLFLAGIEARQVLRAAIVLFALLLLAGLLLATYGIVEIQSQWLIIVGRNCFDIFLLLVLVEGARNLRISPVTLFVCLFLSFELASSCLSYFISPALVTMLDVSFPGLIPSVALATTLLFVGGCFLYLYSDGKVAATSQGMVVSAASAPDADSGADAQAALQAQLELLDGYRDLTPREREIALLLAQGNSYKRVAELLYVSPSTVQTHAKALYRKLAIHSKQELVDHLTRSE